MVEQTAFPFGESKTVADVNPRSAAAKGMEMPVLRGLQLIAAFDSLEKGQDWSDVPGATYRKIIGERYEHGTLLSECWNRYERGTLYREVLDLYENLPPSSRERQEISDGIASISAQLGSRGKRGSADRPSGKRPRRS